MTAPLSESGTEGQRECALLTVFTIYLLITKVLSTTVMKIIITLQIRKLKSTVLQLRVIVLTHTQFETEES